MIQLNIQACHELNNLVINSFSLSFFTSALSVNPITGLKYHSVKNNHPSINIPVLIQPVTNGMMSSSIRRIAAGTILYSPSSYPRRARLPRKLNWVEFDGRQVDSWKWPPIRGICSAFKMLVALTTGLMAAVYSLRNASTAGLDL